MTFLNPFILIGLAAAAIPVLLHLLNLRKLRTIEFSTLTFLKELQKTKIRRIKIRQWLLLVLRTLLVILLVMAFARPTLRGTLAGAFGERARTTSVFILDDSQSMTALDDGGEFFEQAKESALRVLDLFKDGDEVVLLKLSDVRRGTTGEVRPTRNIELLRSTLRETKPSFHHNTIEDALRLSAKLLSASTNFNKEIYLVSDFQQGTVASKPPALFTPENLFPEPTRLFLVNIGKAQPKNVGLESVTIPNSLFEPGKPFTVRARVHNADKSALRNHVASLYVNGERVAQQAVDLQGGSSADIEFTAVPKSTGIVEGMVELENDDLEFDNRRFFTFEIPAQIRVLLVGSSGDVQYIRLALGARQTSTGSALLVREVLPERLSASDVNAANVIVVSNPRDLTTIQADKFQSFLRAGGGLIVFPGAQTLPNSYNSGFASKLKLPQLLAVEHLQTKSSETESFVTFDRVELRHPLFQGMFEESPVPPSPRQQPGHQRSVESPQIKSYARFQTPPQARTVIALSNGVPFLLELNTGGGRVLIFSTAANPEWSDFPLKGLFVPLVHRSVSYLAQGPLKQHDLLVGEEETVRSRLHSNQRWTILSPTKDETVVQPSSTGTESVVRFHETDMPGIYAVNSGKTVVQKFAVNMNPDESRTAKIEESELAKVFQRLGITEQSLRRVQATPDIRQAVLQARFGVELWKQFLIAALIIAIAEMLVARESKGELASLEVSPS